MQFLVTAYDGNDEKTLERRLAAREEHLRLTNEMFSKGSTLYAAAILDDSEKMIGSVLIVDFPAREELNKWLAVEPYVRSDVWKEIDIKPCKVGPMFMELNK